MEAGRRSGEPLPPLPGLVASDSDEGGHEGPTGPGPPEPPVAFTGSGSPSAPAVRARRQVRVRGRPQPPRGRGAAEAAAAAEAAPPAEHDVAAARGRGRERAETDDGGGSDGGGRARPAASPLERARRSVADFFDEVWRSYNFYSRQNAEDAAAEAATAPRAPIEGLAVAALAGAGAEVAGIRLGRGAGGGEPEAWTLDAPHSMTAQNLLAALVGAAPFAVLLLTAVVWRRAGAIAAYAFAGWAMVKLHEVVVGLAAAPAARRAAALCVSGLFYAALAAWALRRFAAADALRYLVAAAAAPAHPRAFIGFETAALAGVPELLHMLAWADLAVQVARDAAAAAVLAAAGAPRPRGWDRAAAARRRGRGLEAANAALGVARAALPAPLWARHLWGAPGTGRLAVFCAVYAYYKLMQLRAAAGAAAAARRAWRAADAPLGAPPTKAQLAAAGACAVCHSDMRRRRPVRLSCGHVFCHDCIALWAERGRAAPGGSTCPLCRAPTSASAARGGEGGRVAPWPLMPAVF